MTEPEALPSLELRVKAHLQCLYPHEDIDALAARCLETFGVTPDAPTPGPHRNNWGPGSAMLITYGDSVRRDGEEPLHTLTGFCKAHFSGMISTVHVLPFFPYSSDDGFAVMDYTTVNPSLGDWDDLTELSRHFQVMTDLVINHCSSRSLWFENYKAGKAPGHRYFIEMSPDEDLSGVVRPRTSPLLRAVETVEGEKHVWCTFSHDQVDLDFSNPDVLLEFLGIIKLYMDRGMRWFRLDAVAFLWKILGTPCINLPETHEVIRLIRLMIEHRDPEAVIITETNIPNQENLTYFGNANEAHMIYNFSLPPLLLHAMLSGNAQHLKHWLMTMPPAQQGTAYLNFIASHDGIGLRPVEGLLSDDEIDRMIEALVDSGARITARTAANGDVRPYEINISLWNAMARTETSGDNDGLQFHRFICAHAVMMALEGVPAFYIHSLLATENDEARVEHTGQNRSINRHVWDADQLDDLLEGATHHRSVFSALRRLLAIRTRQAAFHPNATQYTLHLGDGLFAFWRQSIDRRQSIFAIHNISGEEQVFNLSELNLIVTDQWMDLVSGRPFEDRMKPVTLEPYQFIWLTNRW
ncbi:alpha-amylase family glycosyl hydrolase [Marinobacter sp. JSM 1782161]|uniref:alpha-amylase family glycosyl hydrolase n=1 Tax=Marinobacter sp. JSM 1782161 TaxID=2685906 RepID=UPI0014032764|nr:alpha-amylase family glycosyl hydrolase [Marinobacter sp. JSM 1782161]